MADRVAVISCDTDWAEPATVREAHDILASLGKPITYFVTQRYHLQDGPATVPLEFGLHPNLDSGELATVMAAALTTSPGAVSFRAHALYWSSRLRPILRRHGVRFSSSAMMYLQPGIRTYEVGFGLTEVPIFWMDIFHLEYCELAGRSALELPVAPLSLSGLKVLVVHPVHLVLNTESPEHYARARFAYHDPDALRRERCTGRGIRDLFLEMVGTLDRDGFEFVLVRDAAQAPG